MAKISGPSTMGLPSLPPLPSHSSEAIGVLLWAREVLQKHIATTYGVHDPEGIDELKSVKIGGVDQWLHIRGRNREIPVLLCLHGGPGFPMIGMMDAIQRPWEDYFTVISWDQRQTGKSYYPANDETDPITIQKMIDDTEEVIAFILDDLDKKKLFLFGISWGTVLGMHMAARCPDYLYAYVGVGQIVNMMENERLLFERLLAHAKERADTDLVDKLKAISPYPDPGCPEQSLAESAKFLREKLSDLAGEALMRHTPRNDMISIINLDRLLSPHLTLTDLGHSIAGGEIAIMRPPYYFGKEFMAVDLAKDLDCSFKVPVFFFTGAHDWQTLRVLSDKWFSQIDAPYKELLHFEESSHVVINEEPGKLLVALVNKVLPFAQDVTTSEVGARDI